MFSGLTNQVSSWMGKGDEDVPVPPEGAAAPATEQPQAVDAAAAAAVDGAEGEAGKA